MTENFDLLEEQITACLEKIKSTEGEERQKEINNLETLYKLKIDELRLEQAKQSDIIKCGTKVFEVGVPLAAYGVFYKKGLIFEQTGSYTSTTVRNLLGKIKFPR